MRLTALLRAVLRSEGEFTSLGREIDLIEAYLDIERARFEHRLRAAIDVPLRLRHLRVPPLVVQPIFENAVKHGIAPKGAGGDLTIVASVDERRGGRQLVIVVRDTGVGASADELQRGRTRGVGLRNVERRLETQYGQSATLSAQSVAGEGTTVEMRIPIARSAASTEAGDRVAV